MPIIEELTAISTPLSTCAAVGELPAGFELRELSIMIGRSLPAWTAVDLAIGQNTLFQQA
jgi:hypothetical protein